MDIGLELSMDGVVHHQLGVRINWWYMSFKWWWHSPIELLNEAALLAIW